MFFTPSQLPQPQLFLSPAQAGDAVVDDGAQGRGHKVLSCQAVEVCAQLLLHHHDHEAGLVILECVEALLELGHLILEHRVQLGVRHPIPVHHDLHGQGVVQLGEKGAKSALFYLPAMYRIS